MSAFGAMAAREATGAEVCIEVFTCAFTSFTAFTYE
jgi:hypothetical protein